MKGCKNLGQIIGQLDYMIVYAPNFPNEDDVTLDQAFGEIELGFQVIVSSDSRVVVAEGIARAREELCVAKAMFDAGDIIPACHKLQDVSDLLQTLPIRR